MILKPAALLAALAGVALSSVASAQTSYVHFESEPVRPLAASPDGALLLATNISDNRLEIFSVSGSGLTHVAAVPVGLEPVAVAARTNTEAWVVNHLSDSVSIVDLATPPRVVRTLLVGDEPRDIVFAGPDRNRAFITTARRGQNSLVDPALTTPGIGRANVWVFDATNLGAEPAGSPLTILTLFGDTPRALAASPDGSRVYAAIFHSGNQTVALNELLTRPVVDALKPTLPQIELLPTTNFAGDPAPSTGRIVKWDSPSSQFLDVNGVSWSPFIPFTLPDRDVFAIDADATPPVEIADYPNVGPILFNMIVHPTNGRVYVANGDARNEVRFEGPGIFAGTTVRGRLHEYRITVIDPVSSIVDPIHLNRHIDYALTPTQTESMGFREHSLATPLDMAITRDGSKLFVAAFGSSKVGVFSPSELESDTLTPSAADHIEISGGGPCGLVLDEALDRLYVFARFTNSISVVDVSSYPGSEIDVVPLSHNPEPPSVGDGRPFLYDARLTSSNGEASCSSCHIFARMDDLSWDLGNPDGVTFQNNNVQTLIPIDLLHMFLSFPEGFVPEHHPMKGPMLTQSLRGLANHGPMHWRGDRSGGQFRDDPASLDEEQAFKAFNVAFEGLLGHTGPLTDSEMQAFTDFMLQVPYPPNPIRNLDNSLTPAQANGQTLFVNVPTAGSDANGNPTLTCEDCHVLDPGPGFFGTDGGSSFDALTQVFKVPHTRNLYQRVGMFGLFSGPTTLVPTGEQIRGYGYLNDGFVDNLFTFVGGEDGGDTFQFPGTPAQQRQGRRDMEAFMHVFDTNMLPIMGQQVTLGAGDSNAPLIVGGTASVHDRIDLLRARAAVTAPREECDLVVKGVVGGVARGWLLQPDDTYLGDDGSIVSDAALRALAGIPGQELTFTCVYPGGGTRIGLDRGEDGILDGRQCGDPDGDGVPTEHDARTLRRDLAELASLPLPEKCNVIDAIGEPGAACTVADVVVMMRAASGLEPGLDQLCDAAAL